MNKLSSRSWILLLALSVANLANAQKKVLAYKFQFATKDNSFAPKNRGAHVIANNYNSTAAFVLHDNEHADYVLVDSNFKTATKISLPANQTVFYYESTDENKLNYIGATANGSTYSFVYQNSENKILDGKDCYDIWVETVYFSTKQVIQKQPLRVPATEKIVTTISENSNFFLITSIDATSSVKVYKLAGDGTVTEKQQQTQGFKDAVKNMKWFASKQALSFYNIGNGQVQMTSINTLDLSFVSKLLYVQSIEEGDRLSVAEIDNKISILQVSPKKAVVSVYGRDGKLLSTLDIDESSYARIAGNSGKSETHKGSNSSDRSVDDLAAMLKILNRGSANISAEKTKANQYLISIGVYSETKEGYESSAFRFLMDPQTLKPLKGNSPETTILQVKSFVSEVPRRMSNQFEFQNKQYLGFYENDDEAYIFQSIPIRK